MDVDEVFERMRAAIDAPDVVARRKKRRRKVKKFKKMIVDYESQGRLLELRTLELSPGDKLMFSIALDELNRETLGRRS